MKKQVRPFIDNSLVENVARRKYYKKGENWQKLATRVAVHVAAIEKDPEARAFWTQEFFTLIDKKLFLPGGRILANAGTSITNMANCYVMQLDDSRDGIYNGLKKVAEIHAQGGGIGIDFSELRPEGSLINSTGGEASGPVSFMQLFDVSADVIKQASRRGAMLAALRADHPDIFKFINAKLEEKKYNNFNLSVLIPDDLMEAFERDGDYILGDKTVKASEILSAIAEAGWRSGEPGLIFIDTMNKHNPNPALGDIIGVNPCGEIPGVNGASCILGSINLKKFLTKIDGRFVLDFAALAIATTLAVKFLDNVVSITKTGVKQFDDINLRDRKVGLGVMGWADVLAYLNLAYDSEEAREYARETAKVMYIAAREMSQRLAKELGTYPGYSDESVDPLTLKKCPPKRNSNVLSIAPTGTISLLCEVNHSIEPFFMLAYQKNFKFGSKNFEGSSIITSSTFKEIILDNFEEDIAYEIFSDVVTSGHFEGNPKFLPKINSRICELQPGFKTSHQVSAIDHVKMQAAWQENVDQSISKTINLPNEAIVEDIMAVIYLAWKLGIKGTTVYRDGSRDEQVMEKPSKA